MDTEKVLREPGGPEESDSTKKTASRWKGDRPGVHLVTVPASRREAWRSQTEVSVQKLRENHETIQQLTSHLQQIQEQMNSMNDSGYFQDVESNYSGILPSRDKKTAA